MTFYADQSKYVYECIKKDINNTGRYRRKETGM